MKHKNRRRCEKRRRISEKDRWLLGLDRERKALWQLLRESPLQPLDEPYQKGWERSFVLSQEANRRKDADELRAALHLIRNYQRCAVNPFRSFQWGTKRTLPWEHHLSGLSPRRILVDRIPLELLKHFRLRRKEAVTRAHLRQLLGSGWSGLFWFRYPEYAVSRVQPYLVTHRRVVLPEVESRLEEIEEMLRRGGNSFRLDRLQDVSSYRWDRRGKALAQQKSEAEAAKEVREAAWAYNEESNERRRRPVIFLRFRQMTRRRRQLRDKHARELDGPFGAFGSLFFPKKKRR